jgi:hypothetical protein
MKGVSEMVATLKKIGEQFPDRVGAALYREAQIEMTESKRRCPVDITKDAPHPGQLRASGFVHEPERSGRNISVTMSYGGAAIDYAVPVHENLDAHHPVGQAKYLESVLDESRSNMAARIAARIDLNKMKADDIKGDH